jgi:hydrogenase-1 operon protein HyaF
MKEIDIPVVGVGPGTQPTEEDGAQLDYMILPDAMDTYTMPVIDSHEDGASLEAARTVLKDLLRALTSCRDHTLPTVLDITELDSDNRALIDQVLGDGEVSAVIAGNRPAQIQESVLAGIWRVQYLNDTRALTRDTIEVATVPGPIYPAAGTQRIFTGAVNPEQVPEGVINALPVIAELAEKSGNFRPGEETHVVNLTLLPQTEADISYLAEVLGQGNITILSRGYGNCRIASTASRNIWWVQYFNSQDSLILNTLEVTDVPLVACAAPEDIEDSIGRLREIMEVYL